MTNGKPSWWTKEDDEAARRFVEWEETDWFPPVIDGQDAETWALSEQFANATRILDLFLALHVSKWTCRRCEFWNSSDGMNGNCCILERDTEWDSCCEEFYANTKGIEK